VNVRLNIGRGKGRPSEPISTKLVLVALTLALISCVLLLRTTGPPGYEKSLPEVALGMFAVVVLGCLLILARQMLRERALRPADPIRQPGKYTAVVTVGDLLVLSVIVGEIVVGPVGPLGRPEFGFGT